MMSDVLDRAIKFATDKHSGMTRKASQTPYILHPLEAAAITGTLTSDHEIIAAAVLHDVVEDAGVSLDELEALFGKRVADIVASESEDKKADRPPCDTWRLRKEEAIETLRNSDDMAVKMVFLGDKLANMRSFYRDHKNCEGNFWDRFNQKDPKQHHWYYRTIAECISDLKDFPAWQEYDRLIYEVFEREDIG